MYYNIVSKYQLIFLTLLFLNVYSNSLYTDDVEDVQALQLSSPTEETYNYSSGPEALDSKNLVLLDKFTSTVFMLSQNTDALKNITNESIIFSDINRLSRISDELIKLLGPNKINLKFKPNKDASKLQSKFQETVYKLYVLSPYMPYLLSESFDKSMYYINYIEKLSLQMNANVERMLVVQNQLNLGAQSNLPFNPQTPDQLSFALENQLNSSILNMLGSESTGSDMPFSTLSTPANTDVMNQTNAFQSFPSVPSANASPLQMMNYIPSF